MKKEMSKINVFVYRRKSSEGEDKQIASLESQDHALREQTPRYSSYNILENYGEEKSAKEPFVRVMFTEMIQRIEQGEAKTIITWALSRLARNAREGGMLIDLVQRKGLTIITPERAYQGEIDVSGMYGEFMQSNQFIITLKRDTKRGVDEKLYAGKAPLRAPLGYLNTPELKQGTRYIKDDYERFLLVRKMWDLLLDGQTNPMKILHIATKEWGLRQTNGKPLSRTQCYRLFRDVFYTGKFMYGGEIKQGIHTPMITDDEFDLAQRILGARGVPRFLGRDFSYTRWIKCVCGSHITAEERLRRACPKCSRRFNATRHEACPKCDIPLAEKLQFIVQYHCTRKLDRTCKQPAISLTNLEKQIDTVLKELALPQAYFDWILEELRYENSKETDSRNDIQESIIKAITSSSKRLDNLQYKFLSEENVNGELFNEQEFKEMKAKLVKEREGLEKQLRLVAKKQVTWLETTEKAFTFAKHASYWFKNGSKEQKRAIAQALGSYPVIDRGIVRIKMHPVFKTIKEMATLGNEKNGWFVPTDQTMDTTKLKLLEEKSAVLGPLADSVRTAVLQCDFIYQIPNFN